MATFYRFSDPTSAGLIAYYNPGEPGTVIGETGESGEEMVASLKMAYGNHPSSPQLVGSDIEIGRPDQGFGVGLAVSVMSISVQNCSLTSELFTPFAVNGYSVAFLSEVDTLPSISGRHMGPSVYSDGGLYSYVRSGSGGSVDIRASTSGVSANVVIAVDTPYSIVYTVDVESDTASVYVDGVLSDDTMSAAGAMSSIARISMLNRWPDPALSETRPSPVRTAITAVYDAVLTPGDITDIHALMMVWKDTGSAPDQTSPPDISVQPYQQPASVFAPEPCSFAAVATGSPTPTVAWEVSAANTDPWYPANDATNGLGSTISGGIASSTLSLTSTVAEDDGKYVRMVASSDGNPDANSSGALLTISTTTYDTSTFFGPVLTTDPGATLKWQWSTAFSGADWYDVDDGVNPLDPSIQWSLSSVGQTGNQLNIESATQEQTVYLHCKATTNYEPDGITSSVNTLTIENPAPPSEESPVLLFSDLIDGKRSDWAGTGTDTLGAAVTVWGVGFGSNKEDYALTVGSTTIPTENIIEYGQSGKPIPFLQSITFHLDQSIPLGSQPIKLTNNTTSVASEELPFFVRDTGRFWHIAKSGSVSAAGTLSDPYDHPDRIFLNGSPIAEGDMVYMQEGRYDATSPDVVSMFGSRAPFGAENNNGALVGFPGQDMPLLWNDLPENGNNGVTGIKPYWTISRLNIQASKAAVQSSTLSPDKQTALEGYPYMNGIRYVGLDAMGCRAAGGVQGGNGILGVNRQGDQEPSIDGWGVCGYIHILGCATHGATSDGKLDHAIYLATGAAISPHVVAYNWCYDNNFGAGTSISINYKDYRCPEEMQVKGEYIYGNFVDMRSDGQNATNAGIYAWSSGDQRAIKPGLADPTWCFNNVFLGQAGANTDSTSAAFAISQGNQCKTFNVYNNTVIDGGEEGALAAAYADGVQPGEGITMTAKGNVFMCADPSYPYYVESQDEVTAVGDNTNIYYGGDTNSLRFSGDSAPLAEVDPQLILDNLNSGLVRVANGSPVTNQSSDPGLAVQTRDYNQRAYADAGRFDIGAILAEDE